MASPLCGLAGKLVGELCSPLFEDYVGKPWAFGTKKEFEKLKLTLTTIEAVLLDAEDRQETNNQIRDWLMKIKLVFYDVEDLLQEVTTEGLKRQVMTKNKRAKEVRIFFSSSNQVKYRLTMGSKVKLIRETLDDIASDLNKFNFTERREVVPKKREETHSYMPLDKFIGRDEDRKYLTELLLESDVVRNVSVISIVGIGGLGKTTLAQSVYNLEKQKGNFGLMMWVCVSNVFDVKVICESITESATKRKCEGLQMEGVMDELKKAIDGRKYLLVLDDVWNECPVKWEKLEVVLAGGAKGSKILVTARAELVARVAKSSATHVLKGLSHEESWALFKQVAFEQGVEPYSSTIIGIGKEVVEICAGVPLALKSIGSTLRLKKSDVDWVNFQKHDLPQITQSSEGKLLPILKLSYNYLSTPLKSCFVYCAIFPKDYEIQKETLVGMWMAQGLIQLDGTTRSFEDVGKQHCTDLLDRSLFEVQNKFEFGRVIEYFKMHDLIHDLAQSLGGNEYYNLCSNMNYTDKTIRHALVDWDVSTKLLRVKNLRTIVVLDPRFVFVRHMVNETTSNSMQLRVLVLRNLSILSVSGFVGGLRHLNYLDLSHNNFESLPESLCSLYNLQTLKLDGCRYLKELPKGSRNLVSLRHLHIYGCSRLSSMPRGLGELTCLQTLTMFVLWTEGSNCCELRELKSLVNLRGELIIKTRRGSNAVKCKRGQNRYPCLLIHLEFLQHLKLELYPINKLGENEEAAELLVLESLKPHPNLEHLEIHDSEGERFPSWMDNVNIGISLPNVITICIFWNLKSVWKNLPLFGLLPSLSELNLRSIGGIEYILYDEKERKEEEFNESTPKSPDLIFFPSLKTLCLDGMPQLTSLVAPAEINRRHFPVLEKLKIRNCPLLFCVTDGKQLQSLTSLRELSFPGFSDTETLPAWPQYLPHLQTLVLFECYKVVSLPEWIGNLTSLHEIRLEGCYSLASIPNCIQRLTSLQRLEVRGSPILLGRCEKETGEDWHKISHIPNITVRLAARKQ